MPDRPYPSHSGKLIILLGAKNLVNNPHNNPHSSMIVAKKDVTDYRAYFKVPDPDPGVTASTNSADPYGVYAIDLIRGTSWEKVCEAYAGLQLIGVYEVTEHIIRPLETDRKTGTKSPEPRRFAMLVKPADKSHAEAMEYWLANHPGFCLTHHTGMASYTQNHIDRILAPQSPPLDGFADLSYWNEDAFRYGHFSREDSSRLMLEDCRNFRSTSCVVPVEEWILKREPGWRDAG